MAKARTKECPDCTKRKWNLWCCSNIESIFIVIDVLNWDFWEDFCFWGGVMKGWDPSSLAYPGVESSRWTWILYGKVQSRWLDFIQNSCRFQSYLRFKNTIEISLLSDLLCYKFTQKNFLLNYITMQLDHLIAANL